MNTKKEQKMFALVDAWRESGMKRKEYCRIHHIKVSTFSYWVTRKNKTERGGEGFLRVDVCGTGERKDSVEIHYPNGVRLSVPVGHVALISTLIRLC